MSSTPTPPPVHDELTKVTAGGLRSPGPGSQLRQARADLKLAPEDVARILHLSPRQIEALEADDYDKLPGPTYVRGYLRGYGQLLGLSVEPLVEAYNRSVASKRPVDLSKLAPKPEIGSDHQLIKFATVGVIAIVLGLSAVWWREQHQTVAPTPPREAVSGIAATEESAPLPDVPEPGTSPIEAPANAPATSVRPIEPERGIVPAKMPTVQSAPTAAASNNPIRPDPVLTRAQVPAAAASPVTGARGRLLLQTQLDSWVDVRDAQGNRLLYETVPAGHTVAIEGLAPLSVFLGNASGMRVEFNGQAYDFSRDRRGDTARFTLGEPAGVR